MSRSIYTDAVYLDDVPKSEWREKYIGDGYRSCCYQVDAEKKGRIVLFGFGKDGKPQTFICPHKSHLSYNVKFKTGQVDAYGRHVATKWFDNRKARDNYAEKASGLNIVECMKPESEFLQDMFAEASFSDGFNKQPIRVFHFDIETEISEAFEPPVTARNRINMMTVFDSQTEKFYTWSLEHAETVFQDPPLSDYPRDKFVFFEFHGSEPKLLHHFLDWLDENRPDAIATWNGRSYDMPYLTRRIENVLGKEAAKRLSPVGRYFIKEVNHANKRADAGADIDVAIAGLFNADCLTLYRDKFMVAKPDGGFSLDNIGEHEGLGHKIHYQGTLRDLYTRDYQRFYEYNVRDVDLLKRIDDKCKLVAQARTVVSCGLADYNQIYGSITYLISSISAFAKVHMGGIVFNSYVAEKQAFPPFEGAFVFPTIPGVYRGGIGTIDFASLYPSIIRAINISPETYVGKLLVHRRDSTGTVMPVDVDHEPAFDIHDDAVAAAPDIAGYSLMLPNGQRKKIEIRQVRQLVREKCIYTANNTLFLKHEAKTGVVPLWCRYYYSNRKATKKKMLAIYHKLNDATFVATLKPAELEELKTQMENYDSLQLAYKIMINSIYGCMGNGFSSIANPHLAQSVTRTGKFCNMSAQAFIRKLFEKLFGIDESYVPVTGMDTDSIFINLKCVTDSMRDKHGLGESVRDWPLEKRRELWDYMSNLVETEINPYVRNLVHDYCGTSQEKLLTYELEYMASDALYESKKHYFAHLMFMEGDPVDKNKVTGIELKKTVLPKEMKSFIAEIYSGVVNQGWTEDDYRKYVHELYGRFREFTVEQLAFWKGYSSERQATGFLEMAIGTTGIARAATYYNQLLEKLELTKKYETIQVGNKIRLLYVIPTNEYGIDVIAFKPGFYPREFESIFEIDYAKMFEKTILDPLKRFRAACGFQDVDPSKETVADVFAL